jgi:predicted nucleic acid-binding protein
MMRRVVIDASVAFKWVRPLGEKGALEARELFLARRAGDLQLVAPAHLHVELVNALRYSNLEEPDAVALVEEIDSFGVELYEADVQRLSRSTRLAYLHNLTIYDALYLELAEELECALVTADRKAFGRIDSPVEIRLL